MGYSLLDSKPNLLNFHVTGFGAGDSRGRGGFVYGAVFHLLLGRVYDDKDVQRPILNARLTH